MKSRETTINLERFRSKGSKVFTGRDRGEQDRKLSKIDQLAKDFEQIHLIIPVDIYSINPSYLEEFLVNVVSTLGKQKFYDKFVIENLGEYKIDQDLEEAIDRIIREDHALL